MTKIQFLKIFLIIIAVLMISVTSYGSWKILKDIDTNTKDLAELNIPPKTESVITEPEIDTLDWKVYRNEEYGFEVKYPSNLSIVEDDDGLIWGNNNYIKRAIKLIENEPLEDIAHNTRYWIVFVAKEDIDQFNEKLKGIKNISKNTDDEFEFSKVILTNFNKVEYIKYEFCNYQGMINCENKGARYYFLANNKSYICFRTDGWYSTNESTEKLHQIINSFNFLRPQIER